MLTRLFSVLGIGAMLIAAGCDQQNLPTEIDTGQPDQAAVEPSDAAAEAVAQQEAAKQGVAIGDDAPAWANLDGTDDQQHSLSDLADARAVVVVFTCNSCPVAVAYEDRLIELARDYESLGVKLVAINVNNNERDRLPAMKERAEAKGFNFPYLYDPSQQIARDYDATVTPHVFVLDEDRKIAYMGAIDDSRNPDEVTETPLRDALDALLAGQPVTVAVTNQFGCSIKYE